MAKSYDESLTPGTIKLFSDDINRRLDQEYKSRISLIVMQNYVSMQGTEFIIRTHGVGHAAKRKMTEKRRFRPIANRSAFDTDASYMKHLKEFGPQFVEVDTYSPRMQAFYATWGVKIDRVENKNIGFKIPSLAKEGTDEIVRERDIRAVFAFTTPVSTKDNEYAKFDIKNNVVPLSTSVFYDIGAVDFVSLATR